MVASTGRALAVRTAWHLLGIG